MTRLRLLFLEWRRTVLEAQIANGEALILDHNERLRLAKREMEEVEQRMCILRLSGNSRSILSQAMKRIANG